MSQAFIGAGKCRAVAGEIHLNRFTGRRHTYKKVSKRAENNLITHIHLIYKIKVKK